MRPPTARIAWPRRSPASAALAAIIITAPTLVGCDERLSGKYDEVEGWGSLEFKGHRVYVTTPVVGSTSAAEYQMDGNTVTIREHGASQVLMRSPDGALSDGAGLRYVKRSPS
jgi:hypothetical protein